MRKILFILLFHFAVNLHGQSVHQLYMSADFNKMIEKYGREKLEIVVPPKSILDSLSSTHFEWVEGYRIQLFAASDAENAQKMAAKVRKAVSDSVYVVKDGALYRIQFGDYTDRITAETKVDSMRKYGWPRAWIVSGRVKKYLSGAHEGKIDSLKRQNDYSYVPEKNGFGVQVAAYSDFSSANKIQKKLGEKFTGVSIIKIGTLYKVIVGNFVQRREADNLLNDIRNAGFKDAWVTVIPL